MSIWKNRLTKHERSTGGKKSMSHEWENGKIQVYANVLTGLWRSAFKASIQCSMWVHVATFHECEPFIHCSRSSALQPISISFTLSSLSVLIWAYTYSKGSAEQRKEKSIFIKNLYSPTFSNSTHIHVRAMNIEKWKTCSNPDCCPLTKW